MTWLHTRYSEPLNPPIKSTPATRSTVLLIFAILQLCAGSALRWKRRDVTGDGQAETFCNFFTVAAACAMSVELPQMRANELFDWLQSPAGKAAGWELCDEHTAQRAADEGLFSIAVWQNPKGPGHIAPLVPSLGEEGTWIANVGATNFDRGTLEQGFGTLEPLFFTHP